MPPTKPFALFDDATWPDRPALLLSESQGVIEASRVDEIDDALRAIEAGVARGFFVAGVLSYELGYALEQRLLPLMPPSATPLLRFHLFARQERLSARERTRWLMERVEGDGAIGAVIPSLNEMEHRAKVARVRQLIGDGDVYQVNLTFKLRASVGDPFAAYLKLRDASRAGACAFLRFGDEDVLSFSPEKFFQVRDGRILARPMKGTTPRAPDLSGDDAQGRALVADEKQRAENLMIVDLLRNDLARVSKAGSVAVSDLFTVETYPRFHTLTSGVEGELRAGVSFSQIVKALFPCGSVTGAPKIRAMEIIREVEDEPRGAYCGAIGFVSPETAAFNVGIRTLVVRDGAAEMGVGGGIVWDSDAASEYAESLLKARFFTDAHEPFRLIETMRWTPGEGFHLFERHMGRLRASSRYFGFRFDEAEIRRMLAAATDGSESALRVRLTLGVRGDTQIETTPFALPEPDAEWRYAIADVRTDSRDWRFHHKTTSRDHYEQGLAQARAATGCDEVVFLNERGEVTEGCRTNVFVERAGLWLTPPLSAGVLDGCLRRELIENGPQRVIERTLTIDDLANGQVWFGNALRGLVRGRAVATAQPSQVESIAAAG